MDITSIDNMYEDDGIANLQGLLMGMNIAHARAVREGKPDPDERRIIAIVPEYSEDGRLDRLDVVMVGVHEELPQGSDVKALFDAGWPLIQKSMNDRAQASADLEANPPTLTNGEIR